MTKDMTQGSPVRLIPGFALPLLVGMVFQKLYSIVDTMIVGRFLGVQALAGVGATGSIDFLVLGFCMGLCAGFAIPVAQRFGAGEEGRMREFAANGVWLCVAFGAVLTALTVIFCRDILSAMGTPLECIEEAYDYIVVAFAGIPFLMMYNLLSGYLRALGDSKTPLFFLVFSSVLNVVLDLVFILAFHMGVFGASLASVISQGVSGILCLAWIRRRVPLLHISRREWRLNRDRIWTLCACGVPMGLQYAITAFGTVVMQVAVNSLGTVAVAAVTAALRVLNFLAVPFEALGTTMATYSAQNVGAGKHERLDHGMVTAAVMGGVYVLAAVAVVWCFGREMTQIIIADGGDELIGLSQTYMVVETVCYPLLMLVCTIRYTIQGMGFSGFAMIAGIMEMMARCVAAVLLVPYFGFLGVALGSPLAWLFADVFLIPTYIHFKKRLVTEMKR
ncbi:MAG: MATE family efflux transporter [Clostridia bacterium]|nr:MATE family efflux transporter [Clostridia bacterium]